MKIKVAAVIDKSGSMGSEVQSTINGFKEFVQGTATEVPEAELSLILFDHNVSVEYQDLPIRHVKYLDKTTYVPNGWTALYDAIGKACSLSLGKNAIVCVITDGAENDSKEFKNLETLKNLIKKKETEDGWTFKFLGSDLKVAEQAKSMGIIDSVSYNGDTLEAYGVMTKSVRAAAAKLKN